MEIINKGMALKLLRSLRGQLDNAIAKAVDSPAIINELPDAIRQWKAGTMDAPITYTQDKDVRMDEGIPYMCCLTHTHHGEAGWNPASAASLWRAYHGTSEVTARPYIAPTGAHDMYRIDEYMIWTDGQIYRCKMDTDRGPDVLPDRWEEI